MRRSITAAVVTGLYIILITWAIVANQRNIDPEGEIFARILLAMPWDIPLVIFRVGGWNFLYLYALCIAFNAATLYLIVTLAQMLIQKSKAPASLIR